jgi:hypothetical protein
MDARLETDLAEPLYRYLTGQGYTVRSEVNDCDIAAEKVPHSRPVGSGGPETEDLGLRLCRGSPSFQ